MLSLLAKLFGISKPTQGEPAAAVPPAVVEQPAPEPVAAPAPTAKKKPAPKTVPKTAPRTKKPAAITAAKPKQQARKPRKPAAK